MRTRLLEAKSRLNTLTCATVSQCGQNLVEAPVARFKVSGHSTNEIFASRTNTHLDPTFDNTRMASPVNEHLTANVISEI